jgi:hypothetical protein
LCCTTRGIYVTRFLSCNPIKKTKNLHPIQTKVPLEWAPLTNSSV